MIQIQNLSMFDNGELDWAGMPTWRTYHKMHYTTLKDEGKSSY